ncbi:hypothetical protein ACFXJO_05840 [Streptomyces lavendulae]|uniref:hypothetical protein n=1 Tax=Streptomyces lavendulae TaxID=1914 RepID=UPI0036C6D1E6
MSAPTEPRPLADLLQDAFTEEDRWYQRLYGPQQSWTAAVWGQYRIDLHLARQRVTNWEIAS